MLSPRKLTKAAEKTDADQGICDRQLTYSTEIMADKCYKFIEGFKKFIKKHNAEIIRSLDKK